MFISSGTTKNCIKEYGIKTRFLKNKVIFKVFLETSSLLNLKEVFFKIMVKSFKNIKLDRIIST